MKRIVGRVPGLLTSLDYIVRYSERSNLHYLTPFIGFSCQLMQRGKLLKLYQTRLVISIRKNWDRHLFRCRRNVQYQIIPTAFPHTVRKTGASGSEKNQKENRTFHGCGCIDHTGRSAWTAGTDSFPSDAFETEVDLYRCAPGFNQSGYRKNPYLL